MSVVLSEHLPLLASAPNGIQKLRGLILELAVRGKLVPQDPNDEPASKLLKRIEQERNRFEATGRSKSVKRLAPVAISERWFVAPANWCWVRFAGYAIEVATGPFGSALHKSDYVFNGIPLVNPSHMIGGRIVPDLNVAVSQQKAEDLAGYRLSRGDVVMARRGEVGRTALVTEKEDGWLCGTGSFVIRLASEASRDFVVMLFRSLSVRKHLGDEAVGTTMVNLNHGIINGMPIAVPPLAEQHRIVAKVDELMALCDRLEAEQSDAESAHARLVEALLGTLAQSTDAADLASNWQRIAEHFDTLFTTEGSVDALKKSILQLAVMGKLVPQDPTEGTAGDLVERINGVRETKAANGLTKKIKSLPLLHNDARPTYAPAHWVWVRLGAIIDLISGQHLTPDEYVDDLTATIPYLTGPAEFGPVFPMPTRSTNQTRAVSVLGDILLTVKGSGVGKINRVVQDRIAISRQLMAIRPVVVGSDFIELVLRSAERHFQAQTVGIAIPGIGREDVQMLSIGLPPLGEQKRIVAKVDELMVLCDRMKADLREARCQQSRLAETLIETALEAA